jgi:hypothetical protein
MTNEEYHSNEALGSSMMREILDNARRFRLLQLGVIENKSKAMDFGSAFHTYTLERDLFEDEVAVSDMDVSTRAKEIIEGGIAWELYPAECLTPSGKLSTSKAAKTVLDGLTHSENHTYVTPDEERQIMYYENVKDKIIISETDMELIETMRGKLSNLPNFDMWLSSGEAEKSFFGEIDGVKVKCRPDLLVKMKGGGYIVVDLKTTTAEATPDNFIKSSANYTYYMQDALYREVLKQNGINVNRFIFAIVSKVEHSGAIYCEHDYVATAEGEALYNKAIKKYKHCKENDDWREDHFDYEEGKFETINTVTLPAYSFYRYL